MAEFFQSVNGWAGLLFGSGIDGDVTISSNIALGRNWSYRNLTIDSGVYLHTGGYIVYVADTLTINGSIGNWGYPNALKSSSRDGGEAQSIGGGSTGGLGGTGVGANGVQIGDGLGGAGGAGGTGGSGSGGTGGAAPNALLARRLFHGNMMFMSVPAYWPGGDFIGTRVAGGSSGGSGAGDGTNSGGNGGGGGGTTVIWARNIVGTGTIGSVGGAGRNATAGNCGGGGGGGGGLLVLVTANKSLPCSTSVNGGAGGSGFGTGAAGTSGSVGTSYVYLGV